MAGSEGIIGEAVSGPQGNFKGFFDGGKSVLFSSVHKLARLRSTLTVADGLDVNRQSVRDWRTASAQWTVRTGPGPGRSTVGRGRAGALAVGCGLQLELGGVCRRRVPRRAVGCDRFARHGCRAGSNRRHGGPARRGTGWWDTPGCWERAGCLPAGTPAVVWPGARPAPARAGAARRWRRDRACAALCAAHTPGAGGGLGEPASPGVRRAVLGPG